MITRLSRWFAYFSGIALLLMAILGVADILSTHLFAHPVPGTLEITSALMATSIFLGLAWTQAKGRHVRVEVLLALLPRGVQRVMNAIASFSLAVFFGFVSYFGWLSFWRSVKTDEFAQGLIEVPLWPSRLALALGATLVCLQALRSVAQAWSAPSTGEEKDGSSADRLG